MVNTPTAYTNQVQLTSAFGNNGNINLSIPYKLNFNTIPANIILPLKGDSTCAFSNQLFRNITGVFTANAMKIPTNKTNCVE